MRVVKYLVTLDLPHSQKWLPHFEIDFFLIQIDKVKWVCVTSKWKDEFTVFFKLPIYESIAAIFWQSASYVYHFFRHQGPRDFLQGVMVSCRVYRVNGMVINIF